MMCYSKEIESEMVKLYNSLSEKDKQRYAAIEAKKLGHGGIKYISEWPPYSILKCIMSDDTL